MIRLLLIVFISFIGVSVPARQIRLSSDQIEAMFLKQNLALIAERMNVSIADAAIAEATVWDNPELSVGDINFWKRRGTDEYGGAVASPKQFSLEAQKIEIEKQINQEQTGEGTNTIRHDEKHNKTQQRI